MFDLLIQNATVYDGSGAPAYLTDVAVKDGKIAAIGRELGSAKETLDAEGLALAPGFIDSHSHGDMSLFHDANRDHVLKMGVTTEVGGNCGHSLFPIAEDIPKELYQTVFGVHNVRGEKFATLRDLQAAMRELPLGPNQSIVTGHCNLRCDAMGLRNREPTAEEMARMQQLLEQAMEDGAQGVSSGLGYIPSVYCNTKELIEVSKAAARHGGIYTTHSRYESASIFESIRESIAIAKEAGIHSHISHLKCTGKDFWGYCEKVLELIDEANRQGNTVTFDAYPYTACFTSATTAAIPARYFTDGMGAFLKRIEDPAFVAELRREIYEIDDPGWDNAVLHVGLENFIVTGAPNTPELIGKSYTQIAAERGMDPFDTMLAVLKENNGLVGEIRHTMCEENLRMIFRHPLCAVSSDGVFIKGVTPMAHPRALGTFPRYLGRYIREQKILSREEGIRRMTGLPAMRFGLQGKGFIRPGMDADLVLFDFETIADGGTFENPFLPNRGIHRVYMSGKLILQDNEPTGTYVGTYVKRKNPYRV